MRAWLPAFVLAQMAGIVAVDHGLADAAGLRPLAWAALGLLVVAALRSRALAFTTGLCAFFVLGASAASHARLHPASLPDWPVGVRRTLDARVDSVRTSPDAVRIDLCRLSWPGDAQRVRALPGCVRLRVGGEEPGHGFWALRKRGDAVRARVVLKPLDSFRNPGGRLRGPSLERRGFWARASLAHPEAFVVFDEAGGSGQHAESALPSARARDRRAQAISRLEAAGPGGRMLAALGLGAADQLDAGVRDAFARLGLSHLVAVSGLHLGMTAALGFALMGGVARRLHWAARFDPEPLQWTAAVVCALVYAVISGLGTPAQRALVFIGLLLALHALARRSAWGRAWWCAAALVLAADPAALFDLGPQLSFGVTAALAAARFDVDGAGDFDAREGGGRGADSVAARAAHRGRRMATGMRRLLDASAVALAASALVLSMHGRPTSIWSLCANLVAVPLTGMLLLPSALVAAGLAWCAPEWGWVAWVLRAIAVPPALFDATARASAAWLGPLAEGARPGPVLLLIASCAAAITLRTSQTWLRVAAACACVAMLGWGSATGAHRTARPEIVMLDVGQGDAVLLHAGDTAVLIDAGWASPMGGFDAGRHVIVPALAALGVERLELLVLTHADLDHRGGAAALLEALPVDAIWVPQPMQDAPAFAPLRRRAEAAGVGWSGRARSSETFAVGAIGLEVLWPPEEQVAASGNESSLVLRAHLGASQVLLMGDAGFATERALLAGPADLHADLLKVGHHGSATASSSAFLRAVSPRVALVSAGCSVGRALPHPAALERLSAVVGRVLWTGRDGALRFRLRAEREADALDPAVLVQQGPFWAERRCRSEAASDATADAADPSSQPADRRPTLPLWGGSRRVVAPRERGRRRWGRTHATRRGPVPGASRTEVHVEAISEARGGSHRWAGESSGPAA